MTDDPIADDLSRINNLLTEAHVVLGEVYRRYGVEEGETLVIDPNDDQALAAVAGVRSATEQLSRFLERFPNAD